MKLVITALSATLLAVPAAFAEGNLELGAGYSHVDTDGANLDALTARGTWFVNRNVGPQIGIEGEASFGIGDDDIGGGKAELDHSVAGFGVVQAPVSERVDLFARVGYADSEYKVKVPGVGSASDSTDGVAYGAGAKVFLTDRFGLRGDLTRYEGDHGADADVISVGGVMKF